MDTVLIGSYARDTGIHPGKDVDVFAKLQSLDITASPTEVFEAVWQVLSTHYGDKATIQARSVKIAFSEDGFSVDVVPAVHCGERWAIPAHDRESWGRSDGRWVETDPQRLAALTTEVNTNVQVGGRGAYVPLVKLVRQTRQHHLGDNKPGGLYFEMVTFDVVTGVSGNSFAELFAGTLRAIAIRLASAFSSPVMDPALNTPYNPIPRPDDISAATQIFSSLAAKADRALQVGLCEAAVLWREILGDNELGAVFILPPGCDETGRDVPSVRANQGRGSDEARPFA